MDYKFLQTVIDNVSTNDNDVLITRYICICIAFLGLLTLIGILAYHRQTLKAQSTASAEKAKEDKENAKLKRIAEFRAKKIDCLKGKADDYNNNKDAYLKELDHYIESE